MNPVHRARRSRLAGSNAVLVCAALAAALLASGCRGDQPESGSNKAAGPAEEDTFSGVRLDEDAAHAGDLIVSELDQDQAGADHAAVGPDAGAGDVTAGDATIIIDSGVADAGSNGTDIWNVIDALDASTIPDVKDGVTFTDSSGDATGVKDAKSDGAGDMSGGGDAGKSDGGSYDAPPADAFICDFFGGYQPGGAQWWCNSTETACCETGADFGPCGWSFCCNTGVGSSSKDDLQCKTLSDKPYTGPFGHKYCQVLEDFQALEGGVAGPCDWSPKQCCLIKSWPAPVNQ